MKEVWFQWKQFVTISDRDDPEWRLLNVQLNDEFSMGDLLFSNEHDAIQALKDYDCVKKAVDEKWLLVQTTYETVVLSDQSNSLIKKLLAEVDD
jgi:hypothetical protein